MSRPEGADRSITAESLRRDFGELRAVDGVDLEIPGGQIFGFLGPNGAGKSTLVKILTTILNATSGRATVAGFDVARQGGRVREAIGVALQDVGLDPLMTARELLMLQAELFGTPRDEARKTAERLLVTVGLDDVDPKKRAGAYSGGMKRRLDLPSRWCTTRASSSWTNRRPASTRPAGRRSGRRCAASTTTSA